MRFVSMASGFRVNWSGGGLREHPLLSCSLRDPLRR
jgi:hypothetical protein